MVLFFHSESCILWGQLCTEKAERSTKPLKVKLVIKKNQTNILIMFLDIHLEV